MTKTYSKLTKYSKHEFRQAHRKIIGVLNSCDNEDQFVVATRMCSNFRNWVEFWKNKWKRTLVVCPWELFDYLEWTDEINALISDMNVLVQQFCNFIEMKHQEEAEQAQKDAEIEYQIRMKDACSYQYPKPVVVRGFVDPEPKKRKKKYERRQKI